MKREEIEELKGLAASMGLYDDKNPCKRAVVLGKAIKALEQEPTTKNDLEVDCISREKAIKWAKFYTEIYDVEVANKEIMKMLRDMPSLTPQEPRKGHWITKPHVYGATYCSECDFELKIDDTNFCPNCGADMREVVEE